MLRHVFHAMGTEVDCLLDAEASPDTTAALLAVEAEFERLEQLFSRFREASELSRLNRAGSLEASDDLLTVTELALAARGRSEGRFDPTVHDALVAAGYDRTFAEVATDDDGEVTPGRCGGDVSVDRTAGTITLGEGIRLDLGGIAKGYAVDRACELLAAAGPALVNAGGDLAVRGVPSEHGVWPIGLDTTDGTLTLGLAGGALATSGRDRRRWRRAGVEQHHLIDPATGAPSTTDLLRVTAVASTAVEAEVAAKTLLLAGERQAVAEASVDDIACVLVTADGRTLTFGIVTG